MTRILVATLLAGVTLQAQDRSTSPRGPARPDGRDPWFGTFSIIAVDAATREFGVGVQSRAFGAGAAVPYAVPGVGAIATQASANRQYGPKAIAEMHQALAINPRSEPAIYGLAQRYAQAGDTAKALEQLALAIRRQPVQWKAQAAADPIFAPLEASAAFQRLVAP